MFSRRRYLTILTLFVAISCLGLTSCKTGYGCEATTKYQVDTNKKGQLSTKKGKTNLFHKKRRRKMKSGKRN